MTLGTLLHKNFVVPFQPKRLRFLLVAGLIYMFCNEFVMIHQTIVFTRNNWFSGLAFIAIINIIGALFIPIFIYVYQHLPKRMTLWATVILFAGFVVNLIWGTLWNNAVLQGLAMACVQCLFWAMNHILILSRTHQNSRAYQLSAYYNLMTLSKIIASAIAGFAYAYVSEITMISVAITGQFIVVCLMHKKFVKRRSHLKASQASSYTQILKTEKNLCLASTVQAALGFLTVYLTPAWMVFLGFNTINIGLMPTYILGITLLLTPLMNYIVTQDKDHEIQYAGLGFCCYFLPWLFISAPWLIYVTQTVRTMAWQFLDIGLLRKWYDLRTINGIAVRELTAVVGRTVAAFAIAPLLWLNTPLFIIACSLLSLSIMLFKKPKSAVKSGP